MPDRSRRRTRLLIAVGSCLLAFPAGPIHATPVQWHHPVKLKRMGPAPNQFYGPPLHHSKTFYEYVEHPSPWDPWKVWLRYQNCTETPRGVLRLTVYYDEHYDPLEEDPPDRSEWKRYSTTVVERRSTDSALYGMLWPSHNILLILQVVVPDPAGCTYDLSYSPID